MTTAGYVLLAAVVIIIAVNLLWLMCWVASGLDNMVDDGSVDDFPPDHRDHIGEAKP